jgi:cation diffusion facilitator CzcD-associated flavoprotein CzcO
LDEDTNGARGVPAARPSIAIIGAGFGGVGAAVMLRRAGYGEITLFERGARVGGVWNHNTYPGAACDVPSHMYEFSFALNPRWSRRYAPQVEIQAYVERVAAEHGVLERVLTNTEVTGASWDEERSRWRLATSAGEHEADVLLAACGQLSVPKFPTLEGLDAFAGPAFHTAEWRHGVELEGKRVAIIGTGCSAIQTAPAIAPIVAQLDIYQRSPGWTFAKMDFEYSERAKRMFERFPAIQRLDRRANFAFHELGALAMTRAPALLAPFRAIGRRQINKVISDPVLRAKVTPPDEVGCKRVMLTDEWYPTLTRDNVELITDPISAVTNDGVRTSDGVERAADVIVFATGFKSHGFVAPMRIIGIGGRTLAHEWGARPRAYLGLSVAGFPNMFLLYGPNTNGGTGSVIETIEAGANHVIAALHALERSGARAISIRRPAADTFDHELRAALAKTVWHTGCTSWYVDENGNDPNQWPWLWSTYRRRTARLDPGAYELGFDGVGASAAADARAPVV